MIDTVVFRLHSVNRTVYDFSPTSEGAEKYADDFNAKLYRRLLTATHGVERDIKHSVEFCDDDNEVIADRFMTVSQARDAIVRRDAVLLETNAEKRLFFQRVQGKTSVPSHDYHVNFKMSENADYIEFNLSIPKYFYGHNIAQWIPNFQSERFQLSPFAMCGWSGQLKHLHKRLIEFIYQFFNDLSEYLNLPSLQNFDIRNIEIRRLDFCYNQQFPSMEFAKDFFEAQRIFKNTRIKKGAVVDQDTDTSFYYRLSRNNGFFFKIYLKGAEFLNNDLPRLLKENQQAAQGRPETIQALRDVFSKHFPEAARHHKAQGFDGVMFDWYNGYAKSGEKVEFCTDFEKHLRFKCAFLLREANKVLRYEMSFTSGYISTIYKREVFRKKCPHWKKWVLRHDKIKAYDLHLSRDREKAEIYKRMHKLDANDRRIYEIIDRSFKKKHNFFLITEKKLQRHEEIFADVFLAPKIDNRFRIAESDHATIGDGMFKALVKMFHDEVISYQPKKLPDEKRFLDAIAQYNETCDDRIAAFIALNGRGAFDLLPHSQKRKRKLSKVNKSKLKLMHDFISEGKSIKTICDKMGLSRSTYFRYEADLMLFDVFRQSVRQTHDFSRISTDFKPYYEKFTLTGNFARQFFAFSHLVDFDTIRKH
jgi:hypothetical protein